MDTTKFLNDAIHVFDEPATSTESAVICDHGINILNKACSKCENVFPLTRLLAAQQSFLAQRNALHEALSAIICHRCENRVGYQGSTTKYGDWRSCASCAPARAVLKLVEETK